jgi:hypothetical protein
MVRRPAFRETVFILKIARISMMIAFLIRYARDSEHSAG